jgi:PPIC-type PPIASE domain
LNLDLSRAFTSLVRVSLLLRAGAMLLALTNVVSCSQSDPPLTADSCARVGPRSIACAQVVVRTNESARAAVNAVVEEELFAMAAEKSGDKAMSEVVVRSAKARWLTRVFLEEAERRGALTEVEASQIRKDRWREFDRPPGMRVVHALVRRPSGKSAEIVAAFAKDGKRQAMSLRERLLDTNAESDFVNAAKASLSEPYPIVAEDIPLFAANGELIEVQGTLDKAFASAAFLLAKDGEVSPIVETPFGFHIIRRAEVKASQTIPLDEMADRVHSDLLRVRSRRTLEEALAKSKEANPVKVNSAFQQLLMDSSINQLLQPTE